MLIICNLWRVLIGFVCSQNDCKLASSKPVSFIFELMIHILFLTVPILKLAQFSHQMLFFVEEKKNTTVGNVQFYSTLLEENFMFHYG